MSMYEDIERHPMFKIFVIAASQRGFAAFYKEDSWNPDDVYLICSQSPGVNVDNTTVRNGEAFVKRGFLNTVPLKTIPRSCKIKMDLYSPMSCCGIIRDTLEKIDPIA